MGSKWSDLKVGTVFRWDVIGMYQCHYIITNIGIVTFQVIVYKEHHGSSRKLGQKYLYTKKEVDSKLLVIINLGKANYKRKHYELRVTR